MFHSFSVPGKVNPEAEDMGFPWAGVWRDPYSRGSDLSNTASEAHPELLRGVMNQDLKLGLRAESLVMCPVKPKNAWGAAD